MKYCFILVNAYVIYQQVWVIEKKMTHRQFFTSICTDLINQHNPQRKHPGRPAADPLPVIRLSDRHFLDLIPDRKRMVCAVCHQYHASQNDQMYKGSRVRTWCADCGVGLCIGNCFRRYHTLVNYKLTQNLQNVEQ